MTSFLTNKSHIIQFLNKHNISNYTIRDNLVVDVEGSVYLADNDWEHLPIEFGTIKGDFSCSRNKLKSLKGCPTEVYGDFVCSENELVSLEYGPLVVAKNYYCYENKLKTLEFIPKNLVGDLIARDNLLLNLVDGPDTIGGAFYFENNNVTDFKGSPPYVGKFIKCSNNPIVSLDELTGKFTSLFCSKEQGFVENIEEFSDLAKDGTYSVSHHSLQNFLLYRRLFSLCEKPSPKAAKI